MVQATTRTKMMTWPWHKLRANECLAINVAPQDRLHVDHSTAAFHATLDCSSMWMQSRLCEGVPNSLPRRDQNVYSQACLCSLRTPAQSNQQCGQQGLLDVLLAHM